MVQRDLDFWDILLVGLLLTMVWLMLTVGDHSPPLGGR